MLTHHLHGPLHLPGFNTHQKSGTAPPQKATGGGDLGNAKIFIQKHFQQGIALGIINYDNDQLHTIRIQHKIQPQLETTLVQFIFLPGKLTEETLACPRHQPEENSDQFYILFPGCIQYLSDRDGVTDKDCRSARK
jgi:hypothetical protein